MWTVRSTSRVLGLSVCITANQSRRVILFLEVSNDDRLDEHFCPSMRPIIQGDQAKSFLINNNGMNARLKPLQNRL